MKTRRVNVRGIIFKDGKLLVTKFRQQDDSESAHWGTFGGGLDIGESLASGLHREMIEETGVTPRVGKLLFIQQFSEGEKEYLEFFFHIENTDDYTAIDFSTTSHGELELVRHEFLDPKTHYVLPAFLQTIDIADYITNDKPVYIYNELDT
ncbi:MAG: NUDIX domain-containing protein [Candidatus Microsaccharimonas sp.]